MPVPKGLVKCSVCGDYKGATRIGDLNEEGPRRNRKESIAVSCQCDWIVCSRCGVEKMRRPLTNYYDATDKKVWHSPYFSAMHGCLRCREEIKRKASEPRPFEPVKIIPAKRYPTFNFNARYLDSVREAFVLSTANETGDVIHGTIYLHSGGVVAQPETPADRPLIEGILNKAHPVDGEEIALVDSPEDWFRALPAVYNGASSPQMTAVPKGGID